MQSSVPGKESLEGGRSRRAMHDLTAKRTLVKSPPELWSELSEVERLARHLGAFGEIKITKLEPEHTVAWEGEAASGTVVIEPSGWGTKVTLKAQLEEPEPELAPVAEPQPVAEPERVAEPTVAEPPAVERSQPILEPVPESEPFAEEPGPPLRTGFFARLFGWGPREVSTFAAPPPEPDPGPEPEAVAAAPEPEPEPEPEPMVAAPEPEPAIPPDDARHQAQAVLEHALEALGSAHHRPFSRG
jgi:hypothetical protein